MNPTSPTPPTMNSGAPLSQVQIQSMRSQIGIRPTAGNTTPGNDVAGQWAKFDQLGKNRTQNTEGMGNIFTSPLTSTPGKSAFPDIGQTIKDAARGGINQMGEAFQESKAGRNPIETGAKLAAGAINTVASPLTPLFTPVSDAVKQISDKIASIPEVQKFAQSKGGELASRVADFVNNLATTAGAAAGAEEAMQPKTTVTAEQGKTLSDYTDRISTTHTNMAADAGVDANTPQSIEQIKSDIVNNFKNGSKADPNFVSSPKIVSDISNLDSTKFSTIKDFSDTVKEIINKNSEAPLTPISTPQKDVAETATTNAIGDAALKDTTPAYSKKLIKEPGVKTDNGVVPRVQEGGALSGRQVTPTALEKEAGAELSRVPGYDPSATNLQKYQLVQNEIGTRATNLTQSLESEKILRPPQEIRSTVTKAINDATQKSLLIQKSDPVVTNYTRVLNNAIKQSDGTLAGELKVRQLMDAAYSNARGKLAFGSDKISALDDIHTAARDALNQDLIDHARSTDVKAALRSQWNLYRASDVLRAKAEAEGGSGIERLMQKHPVVTKAIKAVGRATGVGEAVHILSP